VCRFLLFQSLLTSRKEQGSTKDAATFFARLEALASVALACGFPLGVALLFEVCFWTSSWSWVEDKKSVSNCWDIDWLSSSFLLFYWIYFLLPKSHA
jgi:hypothetical protein